MESNNSIYTEVEQELLDRTLNYRLSIMGEIFKEGAPKRAGDIRVANEVLNSIDTAIDKAANTRLKQTAVKNEAEVKATIAAILREQANKRAQQALRGTETKDVQLQDDDVNLSRPEFVPGEISLEQPELTMEAILGEEDDQK